MKLVRGWSFLKIVANNLSLITQIYDIEKLSNDIFLRRTYIIVALQFPSQFPQYLFEVTQKSYVMADILKCDVIIPQQLELGCDNNVVNCGGAALAELQFGQCKSPIPNFYLIFLCEIWSALCTI